MIEINGKQYTDRMFYIRVNSSNHLIVQNILLNAGCEWAYQPNKDKPISISNPLLIYVAQFINGKYKMFYFNEEQFENDDADDLDEWIESNIPNYEELKLKDLNYREIELEEYKALKKNKYI